MCPFLQLRLTELPLLQTKEEQFRWRRVRILPAQQTLVAMCRCVTRLLAFQRRTSGKLLRATTTKIITWWRHYRHTSSKEYSTLQPRMSHRSDERIMVWESRVELQVGLSILETFEGCRIKLRTTKHNLRVEIIIRVWVWVRRPLWNLQWVSYRRRRNLPKCLGLARICLAANSTFPTRKSPTKASHHCKRIAISSSIRRFINTMEEAVWKLKSKGQFSCNNNQIMCELLNLVRQTVQLHT